MHESAADGAFGGALLGEGYAEERHHLIPTYLSMCLHGPGCTHQLGEHLVDELNTHSGSAFSPAC